MNDCSSNANPTPEYRIVQGSNKVVEEYVPTVLHSTQNNGENNNRQDNAQNQ